MSDLKSDTFSSRPVRLLRRRADSGAAIPVPAVRRLPYAARMRRARAKKLARAQRAARGAQDLVAATFTPQDADPICPLCDRPIPATQRDAHHLVPRSHGGRYTEYLHRICHRQIHALFTEAELARSYHTVESLLAHPEVQRFVRWVSTRPPGFSERTRKSARLKRGLREA